MGDQPKREPIEPPASFRNDPPKGGRESWHELWAESVAEGAAEADADAAEGKRRFRPLYFVMFVLALPLFALVLVVGALFDVKRLIVRLFTR